jgi:hypothetical protein
MTGPSPTEEQVIAAITADASSQSLSLDFMFTSSYHFWCRLRGLLVATCVPREVLGLPRAGKPGDIDILAVPFGSRAPYFSRTAAIEVKIVRPTITNPSRNANSLGVTQVRGLLSSGFPLVGLIHACLPEPLPPDLHADIPVAAPVGQELRETGEFRKVDFFPTIASRRQKGRLESLNLPGCVGFNPFAPALTPDLNRLRGATIGDWRPAQPNGALSRTLLARVRNLVRSGFFRRCSWSA